MQHTELLAYLGSERLRKCSGTSIQGISIPQDPKEFLERFRKSSKLIELSIMVLSDAYG